MKKAEKRRIIRQIVARDEQEVTRLACRIWELAEAPFEERESSKLLADYLASRGFQVDFCFPSLPTAFRATWGKGKPVIGFLGEYDALPDCGKEPGTYGHGCGHNLLGVGSAVGAAAAAELLERKQRPGRLVYWGCPAEEVVGGKLYMARDGAFRGLDACLTWHPAGGNGINAAGGSAVDSVSFEFFGRTAHAVAGQFGRSALDAALLTDVAVNYLREHVPDYVRIHGVVTAGGEAPNVVPAYARIWYYVRARDRAEVEAITERVRLCAKGAATATGTKLKATLLTGCYNRVQNDPLAKLVLANLVLMGSPRPTKADRQRVKRLGQEPKFVQTVRTTIGNTPGKASSDEDTVSWLAPLGCFGVTCVTNGLRLHHRELTAHTNSPFACRGTQRAAEVFAGIAWDLVTNAARRRQIRAEFRKATRGFTFDPLIPKRQRPPARDIGGRTLPPGRRD